MLNINFITFIEQAIGFKLFQNFRSSFSDLLESLMEYVFREYQRPLLKIVIFMQLFILN